MTGYFIQAFIYLCAAVIAVPLAKRFGLGSVLGYLVAGVVIGPVVGLVGEETETRRPRVISSISRAVESSCSTQGTKTSLHTGIK
jgi:Kef-type K+ transport system membrane component KefB